MGNSLELEWLFALCCGLFIDLFDHLFHLRRVHVAGKLGLYSSWMYGRRADPALTMPLIKSNREEDVGGLRAPVSQEGFVLLGLKVGIVQVDIAETVPWGSKVDQASAVLDQLRDAVHKDEVAQVIGPELRLETILCLAERSRHYAGIGADHI